MQCSLHQFSTMRVTGWPNLSFCHIYQTALERFQVFLCLKCDQCEGWLSLMSALKCSNAVFAQLYWNKPVGTVETWRHCWKYLKFQKVLQAGLGCDFAACAVIPEQEPRLRLGCKGTVKGLPRDCVVIVSLLTLFSNSHHFVTNSCIFNSIDVFPL